MKTIKIFILIAMAITQTIIAKPLLEQDENLVVEKLANGVTIAVFKNAEPPNRVSMRLLVKRGSLYETDEEQGIAHYTEHMAFNGTKNFPSGDMVEYFQRLGMAFGADTNAHTGFTETVYKLEMPEVSEKLINNGLMLLRDYADSIMFEEDAIDKERSVIIAEKDSRDDQSYRKSVKEIRHLLKGTAWENRMPIGELSVIESVKQKDFLKFYQATYRPENSVVVIVGDVDVKEILEKAKTYFQDWKASENQPNRTFEYGTIEGSDVEFNFDKEELDFDICYDYSSNTSKSYASISVSKANSKPDTIESLEQSIQKDALSSAWSLRIARLKALANSKILEGNTYFFNFDGYTDVFISSMYSPVNKGFDALEEAFRQLLSIENLTDAELNIVNQKTIKEYESAVKSASTRKNIELANSIVTSFSDGDVYTSPEKDLEIIKYALSKNSAEKSLKLLKEFLSNVKIKVFVSDAQANLTEDEIKAKVKQAYINAYNSRYKAEMFASEKLKFSKFGKTGKIENKTYVESLDLTQIEFENGVRLNLKKTDFSKDSVNVKISFGNGLLDIPADKPEYFFANTALIYGGTKFQTMSEITSGKYTMKSNVSTSIEGNSFVILADSSIKDFADTVKYCATIINDSGFREDGLDVMMKSAQRFYLDLKTDPAVVFRFLVQKLAKGSMSNIPGDFENFEKITMSELKDWLNPILKDSYMEISVVGDIDIDKTIELFANTFATLPKRANIKTDPYANVEMRSVDEDINLTYETTDEPRSVTIKVWESAGRNNPEDMRADNILSSVFDDVIRKDIREDEGKVYSPFSYNNSSIWINDFGMALAGSFVVPEYNDKVGGRILDCANQIIENITEDQFERAKIPLIKDIEASKRKNAYWLHSVLDLSQCKPANIELAKTFISGYNAVTIEDVKKRAKEIYSKKPYSISVMPKNKQ